MNAKTPPTPEWLIEALEKYQAGAPGYEDVWPRRPSVGEFCVLQSMDAAAGPGRVVLVTEVDPTERAARVVLVNNETEIAGARDVRLSPEETGLRYEVTAETDVVGTAWWVQLGSPHGRLSGDLPFANALLASRLDDVPSSRLGLPIISTEDSRWQWKQAEAAQVRRLTADCAMALLDESPAEVLLIDDGLLAAAPEREWDVLRDLTFTVDLIRRADLPVEGGPLAQVIDPRTLPVPAGLGIDAVTALASAVTQASRAHEVHTSSEMPEKTRWRPGRRESDSASHALASRLAALSDAGQTSVHLATSNRLWEREGLAAGCALVEFRKRRLQIVTHTREDEDVAA
jgi:hypothetical protein